MASKSLFVLFLHVTRALAGTDACIDPNASGETNKASCCSGSGNGQATVDGVLYEYTCNSYADNYGSSALGAPSAYKCAELCSNDATCHASSWQPNSGVAGGNCWLSTAGFKLTPDQYNLWVILVNTGRAGHVVSPEPEPEPSCDDELQKARKEWASEKDESIRQLEIEWQHRIKTEIDTCQQTSQQKCDNEKTLLEQSLKAECDEKIAGLTPSPSSWESAVMALDPGSGTCKFYKPPSIAI